MGLNTKGLHRKNASMSIRSSKTMCKLKTEYHNPPLHIPETSGLGDMLEVEGYVTFAGICVRAILNPTNIISHNLT